MFLVTVNRYCASGLETMATAKIQSGMAHCIIAGGAESMSFIPMGGYKPTWIMLLQKQETKITTGNGLTAAVAQQFKVSREDQDEFVITRI
jgi:acetyl-CoA acyltransferase